MADQYRSISITGITPEVAQNIFDAFKNLDTRGIDAYCLEYDANSQIFSFHIGGADLSTVRTRLRNRIQTLLGRLPDSDVVVAAGTKVRTFRDV